MAITVLFGKAGSGKTAYCFSQIRNWAAYGGKALLLVPDQGTYGMERRFAETMPEKGFAGIQILGFSRLAYRVFTERGKERQSLSELARKIVLQRLLHKYEKQFTLLRMASRQSNFADMVGQFIWECRSFCISAADLRNAAAALDNQTLARKLQDAAVLYEGYCDFLTERFGDADDTMTLLIRELPHYSFLQNAHIWIDGFHWFTPQQMQVIKVLGETAAELTITLTTDPEHVAEQQRETALFHRSYEVYCQLRELFPGLKIQAITHNDNKKTDVFINNFFQIVPRKQEQPVENVHVIECSNYEVEIDTVARRILELCRQGFRYRDMLILSRSSDLYTHIAERVFCKYHIPCFSDYRRPMTEHPVTEAIIAVLDVLKSHWAYEPLFRLLKTDLLPLNRHDVDTLENYCLAHGIQGYHWLQNKNWTYYTRHFIDDKVIHSRNEMEYLAHINEIRHVIYELVNPLYAASQELHTLQQWCTLLYQWLQHSGIIETLRRWKQSDDMQGHAIESKEHEQVFKQILELLQELVELCGDDTVDLEEFSQMIADGLDSLTFSIIPPTLDHVTITSVERGYMMQSKIVFVCGVNDGIFPKRSSDENLLTDNERKELGALGIVLGPGSRFRSFQERFLFYIAVTRATEQIYLSYALADEEGAVLEASTWIHQMVDQGYVVPGKMENGSIPAGRESEYIVSLPVALRYLPVMLRPAAEGKSVADLWWALYDWSYGHGWREQTVHAVQGLFHKNVPQPLPLDLVRRLYAPQGKLRGSVTKFERYRSCPFAYFSQYGLGLEERPVYRFAAPDLGMLVHGALRLMGSELLARGCQWRDVEEKEIAGMCRQATERLAPNIQHDILMTNAYFEQIKERLIKTLIRTVKRLCSFSQASRFQMAALEKSFGCEKDEWQPLRFMLENGMEVIVTGQIDRVDILHEDGRDFIVVIDYKSGTKKIDLTQVYFGLELQLLTYMYIALLNLDSDAVPAAILYCYVRDDKTFLNRPVTEEEKEELYNKRSKLNGCYLKDSQVMQKLDTSMEGISQYLNLRLKKDGTLSTQSVNVYSEETWQALLLLTSDRIRAIAECIAKGDISIRPILLSQRTSCQYCPYAAVCSFDPKLKENKYAAEQKRKAVEIIKEIEEGGAAHGLD